MAHERGGHGSLAAQAWDACGQALGAFGGAWDVGGKVLGAFGGYGTAVV